MKAVQPRPLLPTIVLYIQDVVGCGGVGEEVPTDVEDVGVVAGRTFEPTRFLGPAFPTFQTARERA